MAETVLNSSKAVEMSVFVVRAFVKMREQTKIGFGVREARTRYSSKTRSKMKGTVLL